MTDRYVKLAKETIEQFVRTGDVHISDELSQSLPDEMTSSRSGAFVSIHERGQLRGCIGTFLPVQDCLKDEIIGNAISAATRDPRFAPVTEDELPYLDINVDVLSEPEHIDSFDLLDPKVYGVIVERGGRRGLLLPDLEGVDTVEQQISIACQKAGIPAGADIDLYRFTVIRHK